MAVSKLEIEIEKYYEGKRGQERVIFICFIFYDQENIDVLAF